MHRRKYINKKTSMTLAVYLILMLCLVGGVTLAFLTAKTDPVVNVFKATDVTTVVEEDFKDPTVKNDVRVKNTGKTDAYIRAKVIMTWQNEDGEVYSEMPQSSDYTINWSGITSGTWYSGNDGFYYYSKSVAPDGKTEVLFTECKLMDGTVEPEGYTLHVEIVGSAIQAMPDNAVDVWDNDQVDVTGNNGTLSIKNK